MRALGARLVAALASFRLALVLLGLLWILTLLGTFEQARMSLYAVQERVFGSAFFLCDLGGVPIPLPGAYLVLALLALNLVVGGIVRMRKGRGQWGVLLVHAGILLLLAGGFVEDRWSVKGRLTLHEGEHSDRFRSDRGWEVVVTEALGDGRARELVVPDEAFAGMGGTTRATSPLLPFEMRLRDFAGNADVLRADDPDAAGREAVDGYALVPRPPGRESAMDAAGLVAEIHPADGGGDRRALLWALEAEPFPLAIGSRHFTIGIRRRSWQLPFTLQLTRFVHEMHPGTGIPSRFSSYVRRLQDGVVQDAHITMNEPLRHGGYTIYQSSWGPQAAMPGARLHTVLAVVRNPSDRVPIVACAVIAVGLLLHFGRRLAAYLRAQRRREGRRVP